MEHRGHLGPGQSAPALQFSLRFLEKTQGKKVPTNTSSSRGFFRVNVTRLLVLPRLVSVLYAFFICPFFLFFFFVVCANNPLVIFPYMQKPLYVVF